MNLSGPSATGRTPNNDEIVEVHSFMRGQLVARFGAAVAGGIRLLYGGSVKPNNADVILKLADVDGALVGGASLKAADFLPIIKRGALIAGRAMIAAQGLSAPRNWHWR